MNTLAGKVAIVTGSTSGIGRATVEQLSAAGAHVVVNSVSSVDAGQALASNLDDAIYVQADVADEAQATGLAARALDEWGQLDILVNNAGVTQPIPHSDLASVTTEVWDRILGVNLLGAWHMTRATAEALSERGDGSIVNISSLAGISVRGSCIPYSVSKAGLNQMTLLTANALGPRVRVNGIAVGPVDTPMIEAMQGQRSGWTKESPMQREGTPDDIAAACLYLATATYVTGAILPVDGGLHLR